MSFGKELKKIRENKNRTQAFMALQLDMAQSTYGKIENDKMPASSDCVYDLLDNDQFTKEEQLILAEKYQEKVDDEWDDSELKNASLRGEHIESHN